MLVLAAGYGVSFLAVCLIACLSAPMAAEHACCGGEPGIRAIDTECCSVVAGVSHGGSDVTSVPSATAHQAEARTTARPAVFASMRVVRAAATSPPLILRI